MSLQYKNPLTSSLLDGSQSALRTKTFGTNFSVLQTGGYMEVYTLNDLVFSTNGQTGLIEYSGNTIPIKFNVRTLNFLPDVLTLESDNISTGRQRLGMLVYVKEVNQVYQLHIDNYNTLWDNAVADGDVIQTEYGTSVYSNHAGGQALISAWSASTIEGVGGITRPNAKWRKYYGNDLALTGGTFNSSTGILTMVTITGGTVPITGFSLASGGTSSNITGGTSYAGTGGTTDITLTLINSGQTTGATIDLSNSLTFENPLPTKESFGSIGQNTTFFAGGKTFQEIIQAMFYPVIPPTITAISTSFTRNTTGGGFSSSQLQIAGTIGNVTLTATYVSGTSTGGVYVAKTGPVTSFVFGGFTEPIPSVTAYTSLSTTAYTVNSNYLIVSGNNTWNCQINFAPGQQPLDDSGAPYYGSGTSDFINGGTKTPANIVIEGVFPISATSASNAFYTQQTLVSMLGSNVTSTFNTANENTSDRQAFILPIMLHNRLQTMELYDGNSQRYVTVTPSEFYTITDFGPVYINSAYPSVAYKQYKYDIRGEHGAQLIRLTFN
jgi:hypothetical protein